MHLPFGNRSTMLSRLVYGASIDWKQNSSKSPDEYLEDQV